MSGFASMLNASGGGATYTKKVTHAKQSQPSAPSSAGRPAVPKAAGLPDNSLNFLHHVPASAQAQQDASGVQALGQGDPAQEGGGRAVASQSNQALSSGAVALIDIATVAAELRKAEPVRRYIGASSIGSSCGAYLTLSLRGFPNDTPSPQLLRIFGDGHRIETLVLEALAASGHKVEAFSDLSTKKQWGYSNNGEHHAANLDGYITLVGSDERMTLEIKSMNRKLFESFQKKGVALSHPHYYDQVQDGLALAQIAGVKVDKCFVIAYCKDNSQFHAEIIGFDVKRADELMDKVSNVLSGKAAERSGAYAKEFQCNGCGKRTSCWEPNVTERGCWHCEFATPMTDRPGKKWFCTIHKRESSTTCDSFKLFRPKAKP